MATDIHVLDMTSEEQDKRLLCGLKVALLHGQRATVRPFTTSTPHLLCHMCVKNMTPAHLEAIENYDGPPAYPEAGELVHIEDLRAPQDLHRVLPRLCGNAEGRATWFPEGSWRDREPSILICSSCSELYSPAVQLKAWQHRYRDVT